MTSRTKKYFDRIKRIKNRIKLRVKKTVTYSGNMIIEKTVTGSFVEIVHRKRNAFMPSRVITYTLP